MPVKTTKPPRKRKRSEVLNLVQSSPKKLRKNGPVDRKQLQDEHDAFIYKDEIEPGKYKWCARKEEEKSTSDRLFDEWFEDKVARPLQRPRDTQKCEHCAWWGKGFGAMNGHKSTCPYGTKNWEKYKNGNKSGPRLGLRCSHNGKEVTIHSWDKADPEKVCVRDCRSGNIFKVLKSSLKYPTPLNVRGTVVRILSHRPTAGKELKDGNCELKTEMEDGIEYIHVFDLNNANSNLLHLYKKDNDNCLDRKMRKTSNNILYVRQWGSKDGELLAPDPGRNITTLCEPFGGGAAQSLDFLKRFDHIERAVVTDLDEGVYKRWRYWKSQSADDIRKLPIFTINESFYDDSQKVQNLSCMDIFALGFMIAQKTYTFNCKVNYQQHDWSEKKREILAENIDLLRKVEVHHGSFNSFEYPNAEETYTLVDPPYQNSLKKEEHKNYKAQGGYYKTSGLDYDELLQFTLSRKGYVVVSESKHSKWVNSRRFKEKFVMIVDPGEKKKKSAFWIKREFEEDFKIWVASLPKSKRKKYCIV